MAQVKVLSNSTRPQDIKWFPRVLRQPDIPKRDCEECLSPSELSDRFYQVYFALQVEWKDGIEYRRGLGRVRRAAKKNKICNRSTRFWGNDVSGSPSGASKAADSGVANGNSGPAGSRHRGSLWFLAAGNHQDSCQRILTRSRRGLCHAKTEGETRLRCRVLIYKRPGVLAHPLPGATAGQPNASTPRSPDRDAPGVHPNGTCPPMTTPNRAWPPTRCHQRKTVFHLPPRWPGLGCLRPRSIPSRCNLKAGRVRDSGGQRMTNHAHERRQGGWLRRWFISTHLVQPGRTGGRQVSL